MTCSTRIYNWQLRVPACCIVKGCPFYDRRCPSQAECWHWAGDAKSVTGKLHTISGHKMHAILPVYATLIITTSLGAVAANLLLVILLTCHLKLRTDTWALTLNLSLCDMIFGMSIIPLTVYNSLSKGGVFLEGGTACRLAGFLFVLLQLASLNSLVWATIDKFAEICYPLRYAQLFTRMRIWFILAFLWIYSVVVAAVPFMGMGDYSFSQEVSMCLPSFRSHSRNLYSIMLLSVAVLTPITGISILYLSIIHIARYQAKRGTFVCNDQHCYYVPIRSYFRNTVILIVSAFYLLACWIPYVTISFYETVYTNDVPVIAKMISTWLVMLTSCLNPWINSLTQRRYRKALQVSWKKLKQISGNLDTNPETPSNSKRHSNIQSCQRLPGNNLPTSIQT